MAQLPGPAAAGNVAAGEEETAAWEDALDLDDSDIRFVPPLPSHSSLATTSQPQPQPQPQPQQDNNPPHPSHHHHRIPRPAAAAVQDTILPRSATCAPLSSGRGDARATDADFLRPSDHHHHRIPAPAGAVQDAPLPCSATRPPISRSGDARAADADFLRPPWLCALQFLGKDRAWERPGIRAIKDDEDLLRAHLVAGVVTSCKPNGLGDLFLVLKDPTGSIGASVHKKVLLEENIGHDISIGCALVLSKVAVFHPSRKLCYLNITKGKVIKVFSKDCAAPAKQVISLSITERSQGGDSTSNIMMKLLGHEDMMPSKNEMTVDEVSHEHRSTHDSTKSTSTWDIHGGFSLENNQEGELLAGDPHNKHTSSCNTDGHPQQNLSIPNTIGCFSTPKENVDTSSRSLLKRKRTEWTDEQLSELDEQLSELFADY